MNLENYPCTELTPAAIYHGEVFLWNDIQEKKLILNFSKLQTSKIPRN